jgi:chromosomal replication initiation ATPase DnaA
MIDQIIATVCRKHRVRPVELTGPCRVKAIVHARHEAMWEAFKNTPLSYPQLGRIFNRDHTTVMHGVRQHQKRLDDDKRKLSRY